MRSTRERDGQNVKNSYLGQVGVVANLGIHGYSGDDSGRRDDQDNHRGEQIVASWRHSSPWNVHWTEQRMSHPKFTNPLYETVISYWRHSENKRTQERLKRITGRYTRSSGTTTSSIGRERDRDCFESQRPNGRTARALSDARALFEIKKMLTCSVDHETTGSWKPNDEIARCHEKSRINAQDESREKRTYRLTLHSFRRTCQRYGGWRGTAPSPCLDPRNPHHTTETSLRYTVLSSPLRRGRLSPSLALFALPVQFAATHIKTHPHRDPNSWVGNGHSILSFASSFWPRFIPSHIFRINIGNNMDSTFDK